MSTGDEPAWARQYGSWAVICGGSEGVGAEFALLLARAGIHLVLIARKPEPLRDTADRCRELGVQVHELGVDLSDPGSVTQIIGATTDLEVGLLIYNAGANTHSAEFLDGDPEAFGRVIDLNVTTPLALIRHFGTAMRTRRRGGIILVGSLTGYLGSARHTVYGGVKAFSRIYAEGLWLELREHGVDVLELVLGVTRTPAMERAGLNMDLPGMLVADPDDVAREGLDHLGDGPVWVAGGNYATARQRAAFPRAPLVTNAHEATRRMLPDQP